MEESKKMKTFVLYVIGILSVGVAIAACNGSFATNNCQSQNTPCSGSYGLLNQCQMQYQGNRCCNCETRVRICGSSGSYNYYESSRTII